VFDDWRRAVGLTAFTDTGEPAEGERARRRPSLGRHLARAAARLDAVVAGPDCPARTRGALEACRDELSRLESSGPAPRGEARDRVLERLDALDHALLAAAREWARADLDDIRRDAEADLAPYRDRLSAEAWQRSVQITADRLLRERLRLPTLGLPGRDG
jgi:hypothetical protein